MSLLVVGLNHRSAPPGLLERCAVGQSDVADWLQALRAGAFVAEAAVLSTCNRVEVYASVSTFHGGVADVCGVLTSGSGVPLAELHPHLYVLHETRAVAHVLAVAAGLDSMLVGEPQILGQLRQAVRVAGVQRSSGRVLGELLRHALRVGKRVRHETGIATSGASIVTVGLDAARVSLGELTGRRALVIGAGSTGSLAASQLARAGVAELTIANRTVERAQRIARSLGGRAIDTGAELAPAVGAAEIVVSATASPALVLTGELVGAARAGRAHPAFLLDLALPRDIDPAVRAIPGVRLTDLAELGLATTAQPAAADVAAAERIVAEEVAAFERWRQGSRVAPTVVALRSKADAVVRDELDRLWGRAPSLDAEARAQVESTVRRVVDKLLHAPTVRVKELASAPGGGAYEDALRELFQLDPGAPAAVSAPEVLSAPQEPP